MIQNNDIYPKLREHLDKLPIGFPSTDSGVEIRVLKHLFTPIEAEIAVRLTSQPATIKHIHRKCKKLGFSEAELKRHLDNMDMKGSIYGIKKGKKSYYKNKILILGMFEYQVNRLTKEFMDDMVHYLNEAFAKEMISTGIYQSRIIPVEKSVPHENFIYNYDDVKHLIRKAKYPIAVSNCICRIGYDKLGQSCKQTDLRESCLTFGNVARHYINHGRARSISKKKAFEVLEAAENSGLILQPGNAKRIQFICTCCSCCCEALRPVARLASPLELYKTNYYAEIDAELCVGCKICIDRCQINALISNEKIPTIDLNRCIGCGLCVTTCQNKAIKLKKKEKKNKPPRSAFGLYLSIMAKRFGRWSVIKTILNLIFDIKLYYYLKK